MSTTTQKRLGLQNPDKSESCFVPIRLINPSPENDRIYKPVDHVDPATVALAKSIEDLGVLEPLVLSQDNYIVSGHRRFAAAKIAGLKSVPCRYVEVYRDDDPDKFLILLREHNRQREKTRAERVREEVVSSDPHEAYEALIAHREDKARIRAPLLSIKGISRRCKISLAKQPMLIAIERVLEDRKEYLPLTARMIHYALLNDPPLRHAAKRGSVYANDRQSYKDLCDLLTRARKVGIIPGEAIGDETRPVSNWRTYRTVGDFIAAQEKDYLKNFWRDLQQSQPNHIEIIGEKNTIEPIIRPIAARYTIPMTIGRGFCSWPPRADMAKRFKDSGKENLVPLMLSDHDPAGEQIAHSFARSMRDDFGITNILPIRVALNHSHVQQYDLPPGLTAKKKSPNYDKFVAEFGIYAYELEALAPEDLQQILIEAIDSVLDIKAFNLEIDAEREDAAALEDLRRQRRATMLDLTDEGGAAE
jgi:hypothetical protein